MVFFVAGEPRPKGSKTTIRKGGRSWTVEDGDMATKTRKAGSVKAWMAAVASAAKARGVEKLDGPVEVEMRFALPKPKTVMRKQPTVAPDVDKLARAVADALNGVCWSDDAQVCKLVVTKLYSDETFAAGVTVWVGPA